MTSGVPSGYALSLLLFLLHMLALPADDIRICKTISKPADSVALQIAIDSDVGWPNRMEMPAFVEKTAAVRIGDFQGADMICKVNDFRLN